MSKAKLALQVLLLMCFHVSFSALVFCSKSARIQCEAWGHQSTHPDINSYQLISFTICSVNWEAVHKEGIASKIPPLACTKVCLKWIYFQSLLEKKNPSSDHWAAAVGLRGWETHFVGKNNPDARRFDLVAIEAAGARGAKARWRSLVRHTGKGGWTQARRCNKLKHNLLKTLLFNAA